MRKKTLLILPFLALLIYLLIDNGGNASQLYKAQLKQERQQKNQQFRTAENSPLLPAQRTVFDSLKYYAAAPELKIESQFSRRENPDTVAVQMSDAQTEQYLRWGLATFTLPDGSRQQLTLFQKADSTDSALFVRFTDRSNGHRTYGGGRYLDVPMPAAAATELTLDFNRAYNPYCAYNDQYSCPQPPPENRLSAAIPAGEKAFHD